MNSASTDLDQASADLLNAAVRVSRAATRRGASRDLMPALMRIEDAMRVLSTAVHDAAADAAPRFRPRFGPGGGVESLSGESPLGPLSRSQEAKLATVIVEAATALGVAARAVGDARPAIAALTRSAQAPLLK